MSSLERAHVTAGADQARARPVVGVLHPGEMGAAVAAAAGTAEGRVLWCTEGRSPATVARAVAADLRAVSSLAEFVDAADVILSVCPPHAAEQTAREVLDHGYRGIYVEANAISTQRFAAIAATVTAANAHIVDGALFGARWAGDTIRFYLAGELWSTSTVAGLFGHGTIAPVVIGESAGSASALKMAHSAFQKAARPLAALAHALAGAHDVSEHLMAEATGATTPLAQPELLITAASKAWRWAPEMNDVASTLEEHRLPAEMAHAAAEVLRRWSANRDNRRVSVDDVIRALIEP